MVPSVVTKGGSFSHATSAPFANPNAAPSANAPARATDTDPVLTATAASTTLASVRTAPIDRSMPSVMMISVIGSASSSRIVDCIPMFARLVPSTKPLLIAAKLAASTASMYAAPGMRLQPEPRSGKVRSSIVHRQAQNSVLGQLVARELPDDAFVPHHVRSVADLD